jgi:ribulose-5-phosphate 4-epimerase/fuculose-1-phosphate aldolase
MAPIELPIHSEIYRQRPDIFAVAHLHPPITTILSIAAKPYVPVIFHGAIFAGGVPVYDDCRLVNTQERGKALAKILGPLRAAIIRGHGAVVTAASVPAVFLTSVYLEENAHLLYKACAVGQPQALNDMELSEGPNLLHPRVIKKLWSYHIDKAGIDFGSPERVG